MKPDAPARRAPARSNPWSWLDVLLLTLPLALAIRLVPAWHNQTLLFIVSALGLIPLAGWIGKATEALAERCGAGLGGLLNATFGNAAELIIAVVALRQGLVGVVKASLTGSILSNMLLVLGASALAGGLRYPVQRFNRTAARASSTSLGLAGIALIVPTIFHTAATWRPDHWSARVQEHLSLAVAGVLLVTYLLSLLFSIRTHRHLYMGVAAAPTGQAGAPWPTWVALLVLAISAVLTAVLSEMLVGSIEVARKQLGLSETFVGIVIVAIVGNAAEHASAVSAAMKNQMDLTFSIAVGSSIQVALFVVPVLVFASLAIGQPMTLEFSVPEIVAVALAVWVVTEVSGDGESNWFEGAQLLSVYCVLALLFYYLPDTGPLAESR
jgi:Ca2+:H+ antiporter